MPVDADALDRFAREVTNSLAREGGTAEPGLIEHRRVFAAAIASAASVHTLADPDRPAAVRMRALHAALEGLVSAFAAEGVLVAVLERLDAAESDKALEAHHARLITALCRLATDGVGAETAAVELAAEQLLVTGGAAAELRWFIASGHLTEERLRPLLRDLDPRAGVELGQRVRELDAGAAGLPYIPVSIAGTALADGSGHRPGDPRSGSGPATTQEEGIVDALVRSAARTGPVVADYQRMRAARRGLQDDGWGGAVRRFEEATLSIVSLVAELLIPALQPPGWQRSAHEKRLAGAVDRQDRLRTSLPRLSQDYATRVRTYLDAERTWKANFKAAVLAAAAPGILDLRSLRYLRAEYPQLAITAADLGIAEPPPAVSPAGPPAVSPAGPPPGPAGDPPAGPTADLLPPPAPDSAAPATAGGPTPGRIVGARIALAAAAAAAGAISGYGAAAIGNSDAAPRVGPTSAVATVEVAAPPPGTRVTLHLRAFPTRDGSTIGPLDEVDASGVAECTPDVIRVPEVTAGGQHYEARVTAGGTTVIFGDRATLQGPTPFTYSKAKSVDGDLALVAASSSSPAGSAAIRAACPASATPAVTMARAIPADVVVGSAATPARSGWDPGAVGYATGLALVAVAVVLIVRGRPRSRAGNLLPALVLLCGALALGYTAHKGALAHDSAAEAPPGAQTPGCGACPAGIRISSSEVQARADSDLLIFRGSWSGLSHPVAADVHLVANDLDVILRRRLDPAGFELVSASRAGKPLEPGSVAASVRPDALLINIKQSALSEPVTFTLALLRGGDAIATVPAAGRLVWDGTGDPTISNETAATALPASSPSPSPRPGGAPSATAPTPSRSPSPAATPVPPADLLELVRHCTNLAGGKLPDEVTPVNLVFGAAPDLKTSASTHYVGGYFVASAFAGGLAGHSPFSVMVTIQRPPAPGSGPLAIDAAGDLQLVAYWDGHSLSRGIRTFAAGQWTMHRDDDTAKGLTVEVRPSALVFYWNGFQSGDRVGLISSDGHGCANIGIKAPSTPVAPLAL